MLDSFYISASSMDAHQTHVDIIANNLANANTAGFKKSKVEFEDLVYTEMHAAQSDQLSAGLDNPIGMGVMTGSIEKIFTQGEAKGTGNNLDLLIQGKGFFEVLMSDGSFAYTRMGHFQVNSEGALISPDGHELNPRIEIPIDASEVLISPEGKVSVTLRGEEDPLEVGYIELASFINPGGLSPLGENLYQASESSGNPNYGAPGSESVGLLSQGFLEGSNVSLVEELTTMMLAQRGYGINAKVLQAADEMLGIINNLRS